VEVYRLVGIAAFLLGPRYTATTNPLLDFFYVFMGMENLSCCRSLMFASRDLFSSCVAVMNYHGKSPSIVSKTTCITPHATGRLAMGVNAGSTFSSGLAAL
jgi:hypothetical protein